LPQLGKVVRKMVRMLVAAGADVNEVSRWGTALHLAVDNKRPDTTEALLAAGADPTMKLPADRRTYPGMSALDLAQTKKLNRLIPMLQAAADGHRPEPTVKSFVAATPSVPGTWKRLKKALAAANPAVRATLKKGATEPKLAELEAALGVRLASDVRTSYLLHDGQKAGADGLFPQEFADLDCEYVLMPASDIRAEWTTWTQMAERGNFAQKTPNPDDGVRADWWNPGWVPIASNGGGDSICIDLVPADGGTIGQVILMNHEVPDRPRIAGSFAELLDRLAMHYEQQTDAG
jgi:cell wall assembly regulator SMI1